MKGNRGFTIFFAVLVASLALSVGLVIYDLLQRSLQLSQVATQSQYAIYAADTGAECALYWDLKFSSISASDIDGSAFATSSEIDPDDTGAAWPIVCNNQNVVLGTVGAPAGDPELPGWSIDPLLDSTRATTTIWFSMGSTPAAPCARVEVGKKGNPSQTTIISHGYNTCSPGNVLRLERALQISY